MTLDQISHVAQTWGLVLLAACFVCAVIYALWPSNKNSFDEAARIALQPDDNEAEQANG